MKFLINSSRECRECSHPPHLILRVSAEDGVAFSVILPDRVSPRKIIKLIKREYKEKCAFDERMKREQENLNEANKLIMAINVIEV